MTRLMAQATRTAGKNGNAGVIRNDFLSPQTARAVSHVSSKDVPPRTETVMGRSHGRLTCLLHCQVGFFVCSTFSDESWHFTSTNMATFLFQILLCSSQNLPFFPLQLNLCIGGFPKIRNPFWELLHC